MRVALLCLVLGCGHDVTAPEDCAPLTYVTFDSVTDVSGHVILWATQRDSLPSACR